MELLLKKTIKSALKFLGITFIVCGNLLFVYSLLLIPILGFYFNLPYLIPATLILAIGIALNMVSKPL